MRLLTKAIFFPSGDQESRPLLILPPWLLVSFTRPVPSGRTVKTFEEMPGRSPIPGLEKAIRAPSGDQSILSASPPFFQGVTCFRPTPIAFIVKIADPDFLIQTNAIRLPAGEKVAESSPNPKRFVYSCQ